MARTMLTQMEYDTIRHLRSPAVGVLCDVESVKIGGARIVCGACGDGYRAHDKINQLVHYLNGHPDSHNGICPHIVTFNGGALNASPAFFPEDPLPTGDVFIAQIRKGMELQQTSIVILDVHAPCGVAREHNLTIKEMFHHLFLAKERIKQALADLTPRPICFCRVDYHGYGDGEQKTYRVCKEAWQRYSKQPPAQDPAPITQNAVVCV